MAIRKLKKTIALVTAMTLAASAIPSVSHSTEAGLEDTTAEETTSSTEETGETGEGTEAGGEEGATGQEAEGNTIMDDGEVVQKGALGKIDKKDWITIDDLELLYEVWYCYYSYRWNKQYIPG